MSIMKEPINQNKTVLGIVLITILLIVGGILLLSGKKTGNQNVTEKIDLNLLIPAGVTATSGVSNGAYLPASPSAGISLVEFGDYECPACGVYHGFIKQLLTEFSGKFNYVFRNYPLSQHKNAPISSQAVEAAGLQDKYWQMHDKVFENQTAWAGLTDPKEIFLTYAGEIGLDSKQFLSDLTSQAVKDRIDADTKDGNVVGLSETPTLYLNGKKIVLEGSYAQMKKLLEDAINGLY
jgi:protein-disulfide isomerase